MTNPVRRGPESGSPRPDDGYGKVSGLETGLAWWRTVSSARVLTALLAALALTMISTSISADSFDDSPPAWEPLLWGGRVSHPGTGTVVPLRETGGDPALPSADAPARPGPPEAGRGTVDPQGPGADPGARDGDSMAKIIPPVFTCPAGPSALVASAEAPGFYCAIPYRSLVLRNVPPLYSSPRLPGEGVWQSKGMPTAENGLPLVYKTSYRPSVDFPNAVVHMLLFDMKQISVRLYIGSTEPGASQALSQVEPENLASLLAITNGLWKLRHSGGGGVVFRGTLLKEMTPGLATIVIFKNGRVDILEWDDGIPVSDVSDARQLKHLIVNEGRVVTSVVKNGKEVDAEIGMGALLNEAQPTFGSYWGFPFGGGTILNHTSGPEWFIATRSAFGIRPDGNLVFAVGHHIGTKDLAKALVLAGCVRAIHGDANPGNVLGNLYRTDAQGAIVNVEALSPKQGDETLKRYVNGSYTSDFFAFFRRDPEEASPGRTASSILKTLF